MATKFQFKQFSIVDEHCGMPVSTDGVLLGAWASAQSHHHILDIGTGTGLLALMMAQRFSASHIVAIDIDEMAAKTAQFNSAQSAWSDRIKVVCADIISWKDPLFFDTIICNPPYFSSGNPALNSRRATARHTGNLAHTALLSTIKSRLTPTGNAYLILPTLEADQLLASAAEQALFCQQITTVKSTPNKPISRKLINLSLTKSMQCIENQLIIQEMGKYSDDFVALTKDFYLKM